MTNEPDTAPLVKLGQGDAEREIMPEDILPSRRPAERAPGEPSFLRIEPAKTYHAKSATCLSSHYLGDFRKCPAYYMRKRAGLVPVSRGKHFVVGSAAHSLILEGREAFEAEFAVGGPINEKTGKPYGKETKAFKAWEKESGKTALDDDDYETILVMKASVLAHAEASDLLSEGVPERVVRTKFQGRECQARYDWLRFDNGGLIVDLKTCRDLDSFEDDFKAYGYAHQMAFYRSLLRVASGGELSFGVRMIAVEKREPYRTGVWFVTPETLRAADAENLQAIADLEVCEREGAFPTGYEIRRSI